MAATLDPINTTTEQEFPVLFTIESSSRHELFLLNTDCNLQDLNSRINHLIATSPNAAEFMGKYRSKDITESVSEITVKWAAEGRDSRVFVKETLVTEENLGAVLRMMAHGVGRDIFDVKVRVGRGKVEGEGKK